MSQMLREIDGRELSSPAQFLKILWKYRQQMQNFVDWAAERRREQARAR